MAYDVLQSSTQSALLFFMTDSADHITGKTGLSPTVTVSKNGGSFGSPSGAVTEIANGWYKVAGNATDTDTLGPLALHATGTGADPCDLIVANIVAYNPQDSVRAGLTALPNAAAAAADGLIVNGSNTGAITLDAVTITPSAGNTTAVTITGAGTGHGIRVLGGNGASSSAVRFEAASTNGIALLLAGTGTREGLSISAGATGNAVQFTGGATSGAGLKVTTTSGDGVSVTPTAGNGITITANGTSKHGVVVTGGTAGTSDGVKVVAGTGGVGLRGDTVTLSGAVSLESTLSVTGTTTLAAVNTGAVGTGSVTITGTLSTSGTVTFNAFTVTGVLTAGSFVNNGVTDVAQTGDSFARIGSTGSGLTSLAPAATALSTVQWTNTLATNIGTTNSTVATNLDTTVSSRAPSATALSTATWTGTLATNIGTTNTTVAANLDAAITSRQATFTSDTGVAFPTNFGSMDISATGGVGVDWANIQNPTTVLNLSGTTIKAVTDPVSGGTDLTSILGTAITESAAGRLAGAFSTLLNVASPVLTVASVNQTGDSFARIGANGSGLTSLAPASTALSTATWTGTLATNLGTTNTTVATNLDATVSSRQATFTAATGVTFPTNFSSALTLPTDAQLVKVLAAVYDTATGSGGNVLTLSNGATQTINLSTGTRTTA